MKVLWAYDPFHHNKNTTIGMHQILKQLAAKPSNIEVGYVVTRNEPNLSLAFDVPQEERFSIYPLRLIKESLKRSNVTIEDNKIHVVDYDTLSNTKAVERLLKLAKSRSSDLIALQTQSLQGFQRFVIGSFAETAIHLSRAHLLLVNPKMTVSKKVKNIFFMTDFSPTSKKHLKQVISISKQFKANLVVFHAAEVVYKMSLDDKNPKIQAYRRKIAKEKASIEQDCRKASLKGEVIIGSEMAPISEVALKSAKKFKSDLIVVAAKSGAIKALMGGSITRQIVRESSIPVLILK
jgi:nucleotide-binding universal stress UspA family protein